MDLTTTSIIRVIIATVLLLSASVDAQEADDAALDDDLFLQQDVQDEIVAIGSRVEGGGRRADASREQLDDSFETDMAGFFDDIPGLSTLGGDDEGNGFSIDGLSPDLSQVSLDGQSFGQGRGNGGFNAGDLPPEMLLRVNVDRIPSASMEEGGAAGRVNLQFRSPIDIKASANSLKGRLGFVPETSDSSPAASYFAGRRADSGKLGFMVSVSSAFQNSHSNRQDVSSWAPFDFDGQTADLPQQVRNSADVADQDNLFAALVLGFRPSPGLDVKANAMLIRKDKSNSSQALQHRFERQREISVLDFDERIVTAVESIDANCSNLRVVGSDRVDRNDSAILGADINWRNEFWRVVGAAGYSTSENASQAPSQTVSFAANSPFGYVLNADSSIATNFSGDAPPLDEFAANRINLSDRNTRDTNAYSNFDLTRFRDDELFRRIRFGVKLRELTRSKTSQKGLVDTGILLLTGYGTEDAVVTPWDTAPWPEVNMHAVGQLVDDSSIDWTPQLLNEHDIEQHISAAYLQGDFRVERDGRGLISGNLGARFVSTKSDIGGFEELGAGPVPVITKVSYTDFLPSISVRMRPANRLALVFGVASVMTRPSFNNLAPGTRYSFSDKTAKSGNPELLPFRADQITLEVAWVPTGGARLNGHLSYWDVENFVALGEETIDFDDDTYLVTRPVNGGAGSILSAGVRFQQSLRRWSRQLRDFALSLSYTRNDSSTEFRDPVSGQRLPLPNTAKDVVKADIGYNRKRFGARLRYRLRGESLKSSFSDSGLAVWNQPVASVDLNIGWRLSDAVQLGLNAKNLLGEDRVQTTDYSGQLLRVTEGYRQVALTVRARW